MFQLTQDNNGTTQTFTFPYEESLTRKLFMYIHGSQKPNELTVAIGIIRQGSIAYVKKLHGDCEISYKGRKIISSSQDSWATGWVIY